MKGELIHDFRANPAVVIEFRIAERSGPKALSIVLFLLVWHSPSLQFDIEL